MTAGTARCFRFVAEPDDQGSCEQDASNDQEALTESHDKRGKLNSTLQRFVGAFHCHDRISALLTVVRSLGGKKSLNLQAVRRHSFADPKIMKLLSLGDHGAEKRRAHASTKVAGNVKKSGAIALFFSHQARRRDR